MTECLFIYDNFDKNLNKNRIGFENENEVENFSMIQWFDVRWRSKVLEENFGGSGNIYFLK